MSKKNEYKNIVLISQLGISMMTPIFLCLIVGIFIDKEFGTSTVLPLLFLGILAGGRNTYMLAKKTIDDDEHKKS